MNGAAPARHGRSRPGACSVVWDDAQVSTLGTAPLAQFWVALEQNGPWGAQAATQSHLDPDLGAVLTQSCQDADGRFILIRRPGTHSDPREPNPDKIHTRKVYVAGGLSGRPWLLEADLDEPALLAGLPWIALAGGDIGAVRDALPELAHCSAPMLMICANSKRDVCCSVRGRPVALESALERPGQVWECSHTGGHRFAPTGVLLPHGNSFGRLSGASAIAAIDAAARGEVPVELLGSTNDRGLSHLTAPEQAAESIVRQQIQETSLLALSTTAIPRPDRGGTENPENAGNTGNTWQCRVSHVDGRQWDVAVAREPSGDDLPESCGREPVPSWQWSGVSDLRVRD
ncbi:MAG: hypothetical protein QOE58_367 [Actinomycetota bacterium]|nr:hypothetical protein [Actinomycetota bacterium]